ncbi:hypothetical protein JEY40_09650 [Bradyrhizobium japonicum]|uniref:hypothetical protein n=1 Tax=Bradyrhizobium japonicum TaxID=375 RepID=UPI00200C2E6D|nr:hypothetical protein [Bradyrhizobium japonicum]UQD74738.1 hypothetical protein JEY40_09650 [Bradyrhizobium japonicum]
MASEASEGCRAEAQRAKAGYKINSSGPLPIFPVDRLILLEPDMIKIATLPVATRDARERIQRRMCAPFLPLTFLPLSFRD